ncbi:MAG: ABC transporter permease [Chitinophagaceae bacterium]|nr:ABC transporter permease [Chitinophagaceae bacterium]
MFFHYLKTAWRSLKNNRIFSIINITGLAAGLTCVMLIALFIWDETSYDRHSTAGNIYRVNLGVVSNGTSSVYPMVDAAVGQGMQAAFPEIKASCRLRQVSDYVKQSNIQFKEKKLAFADENFLDLFSIPLIRGNSRQALAQPHSVVISKEFSDKYFGSIDPIGKSLVMGLRNEVYQVTGLYDKIPANSHFHFDAVMSFSSHPIAHPTWSNVGFYTYLLLDPKADIKKLESKFPKLVEEHVVPEVMNDMGVSLAEAKKSVGSFIFSLQPLADIHLRSHTKYELEANGDIQYIYIFSSLGLFILLLACINFTNLSTARAVKRSKEVGVRKLLGSARKDLIRQFLSESVLLSFCALFISVFLLLVLLPYFNQLSGKSLQWQYLLQFRFLLFFIALGVVVGIVAGSYPAFYLSSFDIVKVLKGTVAKGAQKRNLQSGLVVLQFFISTALITATLIVSHQLHYMQSKKLGYDKEQVLVLSEGRLLGANQDAFKEQLLHDPRVASVSIARVVPGDPSFVDGSQVYPRNENSNGAEIHSDIFHIDYDYLKTFNLRLASGRNFSKDYPTDSTGVLINEAAVRELGWSGTDPVGKIIVRSGQLQYHVIGVVRDFNYASVKQSVSPLMLLLGGNYGGFIVKVKTPEMQGFLADLKQQWDAFHPAGPFSYQFLDEQFARLYAAETHTLQIFSAFAVLAVVIASLGLFGLSAFVLEQRTKEIGIRKVLGASVQQVLVLVSKDFLVLVGLGFLVSIPFIWWMMNKWLQDYAYRIQIGWWIFAIAGAGAFLLAVITVSFQAVRAATSNPVKSLRTE